jgi:hypothetical protein
VSIVYLFPSSFSSPCPLPLDDRVGEVLGNKIHVVRLELFSIRDAVTLGVQIIGVEGVDSLEHLPVLITHEVLVRALPVPGVERVVANHGKGLIGEGGLVLDDVVKILVMTPREHDVVKTTVGRVDAELGVKVGVDSIGVSLGKCIRVDDLIRESTANGESITNNVPLSLSLEFGKKEHQLAKVVNETSQLHPSRLAIAANSFSRLEEMLDLREGGVGVGLVNESVEFLHSLPDGHLGARTRRIVEAVTGSKVVSDSLLMVLFAVEVLDAIGGIGVLAEGVLVLLLVELGGFIVLDHVDIVDVIGESLESLTIMAGEVVNDSTGRHCEVCETCE